MIGNDDLMLLDITNLTMEGYEILVKHLRSMKIKFKCVEDWEV